MKQSAPSAQAALARLRSALRGRSGCMLWVPLCAPALLAAYPPLEWPLAAWLAYAPLALGLRLGQGRAAIWAAAGWLHGVVFWGVQFSWLHHAFVTQAGMGWLHFANFYALAVALLALAPAAELGLARWAWLRAGLSPFATLPVLLALREALLGVFPFGGVVWGSVAAPLAGGLAARMVVPVLGAAGLVLLVGLVNAGWAAWVAALARWSGGRGRLAAAGLGWLALTALCLWPAPTSGIAVGEGIGQGIGDGAGPAASVPVMLVPGDLSLRELHAGRERPGPLRYYMARTLGALGFEPARHRPTLVVWPESAVPGRAARGKALADLAGVGELLGVDFLLGSNARVRDRDTNAAYLVQGRPFDLWRYDKHHLVPFGEYVPHGFRWLFPAKLTRGEHDYAAGGGPPVLVWHGVPLGVAICFESILPAHIAAAVRGGARVIVAMANDAWLTPAARRQHLQLTALRGLEAGRDVVLVANRGWSALLRGGRPLILRGWWEAPEIVWVRPRDGLTPYLRYGLAPAALAAAALLLAALWLRRVAPAPSHGT